MKKLFTLLTVLALLLPVLAGCQSSAPAENRANPTNTLPIPPTTETNPTVQTTAPTETVTAMITAEDAIAIALKDANLQRDQVFDLDVELDRDNGVAHYDVDFEKDKKDYDYEIHAETGEILKKEVPAQTASTTTDTKKQLTRDEAKSIALKHAGFTASQVMQLEVELDRDDGKLHYDVDFEKDGYDYDYEIDAYTGKILKSQKERD